MKNYILILVAFLFCVNINAQNFSQGMADKYTQSTITSVGNKPVPSSVLFTEFATKAPITGGSGYIQNGLTLQSTANYNISGSGLAANLTASTQFSAGAGLLAGTTGYINTFSSTNIGLVIRGVPSQTAVLASFQNSGGTELAAVRGDGRIRIANGTVASDAVNKSQLDLKADLASPTLTGTPAAPTATAGTNTTQLATTAFVQTELNLATGWGQYADTVYTSGSPLSLVANTNTNLPNNKGNTIETQKPSDITTFYNGTTITGRNGDGIMITIDFKAVPTEAGTTYLEVWFDIGGSVGELYRRIVSFPKGTGEIRPIDFTVAGYTLDTWQTNGATVKVRANGTCDIYDIRYVITRTHKAN